MWTTEGTTELISDDDARTLLHEQMGRRIAEIQRNERQREREQTAHWQAQERELRDRMLRAEWPESGKRSELDDILFGRKDKKEKDKILKPLPDELFEID